MECQSNSGPKLPVALARGALLFSESAEIALFIPF